MSEPSTTRPSRVLKILKPDIIPVTGVLLFMLGWSGVNSGYHSGALYQLQLAGIDHRPFAVAIALAGFLLLFTPLIDKLRLRLVWLFLWGIGPMSTYLILVTFYARQIDMAQPVWWTSFAVITLLFRAIEEVRRA